MKSKQETTKVSKVGKKVGKKVSKKESKKVCQERD